MEAEPDRFVTRNRSFGNIANTLGFAGFGKSTDHIHDVTGIACEQGFDAAIVQAALGPAINACAGGLNNDPLMQGIRIKIAADSDANDHFVTAERHLFELEDRLINRQAIARFDVDDLDHAVAFGLKHIFHLHGFDHRQFLAALDVLSGFNRQRHQQSRHW